MDTRVWLLEKYFPLMLQAALSLSVKGGKKGKKNKKKKLAAMQREERVKIKVNVNKRLWTLTVQLKFCWF